MNFTMYCHIFGEKSTLKFTKNCIFCLKQDFEPQYFNLRTIKNLVNFSVKNVLKISPKLRLSVLINFVLIKKKSVSSLKLAQVKGQSLLVGNLVSTDISLFWQEQPVSRYTQLRKEYDRSIYAKHLIWEIYFWSFLQIFYLVRENKIWSINQRKFICHLKYIHSLSKTEWFDIEA